MKIFILLFLFSLPIFAQDFCSRTNESLREQLEHPTSRIAFKNSGGLFNGGVCWWHSRLQRSSLYLARFNPSAPKPSARKVRRILNALRTMKQVVVIPGYDDFESFTLNNKRAVQSMLEKWQRADGFLNQQWLRGISGRSTLPADALAKKMQEIYRFYWKSPVPVWLMAQIKGITAHSFLLLEMNREPNGFHLKVVDSNRPDEVRDIVYTNGDENMHVVGSTYRFILYVGFQEDFRKMASAIRNHCSNFKSGLVSEMAEVSRGDIEID